MAIQEIYQPTYRESWALVVGINKYISASPLSYAVNDAHAIAKTLEERLAFPKSNIVTLTDSDAIKTNILQAYLRFEEQTSSDDRIIVFYAGHGCTVSGRNGEVGYLVPYDGNLSDKSTLIRWEELTRNTDIIPAKHLFIMDACYGGLALKRGMLPVGTQRFVKNLLQRCGRQVITAGKDDEAVLDQGGSRVGHSIFTSAVLDALEGAASTTAGVITATSVMHYVYDHVGTANNSDQTPHFGTIEGDGDLILNYYELKGLESNEDIGSDIMVNVAPSAIVSASERESVVTKTKRLMSDARSRIELSDYVDELLRKTISATDKNNFPAQNVNLDNAECLRRISAYESSTADLMKAIAVIAKWHDETNSSLIEGIIKKICEQEHPSSGYTILMGLGWYPATLLMYVAGIMSLNGAKYHALRMCLDTLVKKNSHSRAQPAGVVIAEGIMQSNDAFKALPDHQNNYVPRSEYLFKSLQPIVEDIAFVGLSYERYFDYFEVFWALEYAYQEKKETGHVWGPVGRFGWKFRRGDTGENPFIELFGEANTLKENWGPIKAGLFGGSFQVFQSIADEYRENLLKRLGWR